MREIKFKAWWIEKNILVPVDNIYYEFYRHQEITPSVETLIIKNITINTYKYYPYKNVLDHGETNWKNPRITLCQNELVLMQYTGLKDRNAKEIYEGDIISFDEYHKKVIKFDSYHDLENSFTGYDLSKEEAKKCEVIGNKYETPELLKQ